MPEPTKLKVAFIGTGNVRGGHLAHLSQLDGVDLVAFCDISDQRSGLQLAQHDDYGDRT